MFIAMQKEVRYDKKRKESKDKAWRGLKVKLDRRTQCARALFKFRKDLKKKKGQKKRKKMTGRRRKKRKSSRKNSKPLKKN